MADRTGAVTLPTQTPRSATPDQRPLAELIEILEAQRNVYEDLLGVTEAKRDAMVDVDIPMLEQVLEREDGVVARLNELETVRVESLEKLKGRWGVPAETELDVTGIIGRTSPGPLSERLVALKEQLRSLAERCRQINEMNRQLADQSLSHIHQFLSLLVGEPSSETYSRRGCAREFKGRLMVDRKA